MELCSFPDSQLPFFSHFGSNGGEPAGVYAACTQATPHCNRYYCSITNATCKPEASCQAASIPSSSSASSSLPSFWKLGLFGFLLLVIRFIFLLLLHFFTSIFQLPLLERVKTKSKSKQLLLMELDLLPQSHFGPSPKNVRTAPSPPDTLSQTPDIYRHGSGTRCLQHFTAHLAFAPETIPSIKAKGCQVLLLFPLVATSLQHYENSAVSN